MITRAFYSAAIGMVLAASLVQAQTERVKPPAPPSGPLIRKHASNFATWTITTSAASGSKAASAKPGNDGKPAVIEVVQIQKTGDVRNIKTQRAGATGSEVWCNGSYQITRRPEWKEPMLSTGENLWDAARVDFGSSDFAGFDWITEKNFVGLRKIEGRDCLTFQDRILPFKTDPNDLPVNADGSRAAPLDPEALKVDVVACTDLESRLPMLLKVGDVTSAYKYGQPPSGKLILPPDLQAVIDRYVTKMQARLRPPARP